jgi:uncharacterized protein YukE
MTLNPSVVHSDPVKMRDLSRDVDLSRKHWGQHIDELSRALGRLKRHCVDDKIDEFECDFKKVRLAMQQMEAVLADTNKHLLDRADELEKAQQ